MHSHSNTLGLPLTRSGPVSFGLPLKAFTFTHPGLNKLRHTQGDFPPFSGHFGPYPRLGCPPSGGTSVRLHPLISTHFTPGPPFGTPTLAISLTGSHLPNLPWALTTSLQLSWTQAAWPPALAGYHRALNGSGPNFPIHGTNGTRHRAVRSIGSPSHRHFPPTRASHSHLHRRPPVIGAPPPSMGYGLPFCKRTPFP